MPTKVDFRALFEASPDPYLVLSPDADFTIVAVADLYLSVTNTRREDILGRGLFEVFPDNSPDPGATGLQDLRTSLRRVLAEKKPDAMGVCKCDIPRRDGSVGFEVRYWSPVNTPVLGPGGEVMYIVHRVGDVTAFVLQREKSQQEPAPAETRDDPSAAEVLHDSRDVTDEALSETAGGGLILVADDDADMRDFLCQLLQSQYRTRAVANGEEALAALRERPRPDLVLSDVIMPRLDGIGLLRAVRSDPALADLPVILLSARAGEGASLEGLEAAADDYIVKPFGVRELLGRVRSTLQMARVRRMRRDSDVMAALRHSEQRFRALAVELAGVNAERAELLRRFIAVQEGERQRIARELHDSLGQYLAVLRFGLGALEQRLPGDDAASRRQLKELKYHTTAIGEEVRRLAWELRPTALDDLGLRSAISQFLDGWSGRFGVAVEFHCGLGKERLAQVSETTLYRVLQEAMTNIAKHAGANRVSVILEGGEGEVRLVIEDNGRGFRPDNRNAAASRGRHFGLLGMKERVALAGGSLEIEAAPGRGTNLFVRLPNPVEA